MFGLGRKPCPFDVVTIGIGLEECHPVPQARRAIRMRYGSEEHAIMFRELMRLCGATRLDGKFPETGKA